MFEEYKLNKYQKYISAFVYDTERRGNYCSIQTYIVLNKDDNYKFIKYKKYKKIYSEYLKSELKKLEQMGYESLENYIKNKNNNIYELNRSKIKIIKKR